MSCHNGCRLAVPPVWDFGLTTTIINGKIMSTVQSHGRGPPRVNGLLHSLFLMVSWNSCPERIQSNHSNSHVQNMHWRVTLVSQRTQLQCRCIDSSTPSISSRMHFYSCMAEVSLHHSDSAALPSESRLFIKHMTDSRGMC